MRKLTFLVYHKEYDHFLSELQKLGVLHIQPCADQSKAEPKCLQELRVELENINRVEDYLLKMTGTLEEDIPAGGNADNARGIVSRVDEINSRLTVVVVNLQKAVKDAKILKPWGNINPEDIKKLHEAGVQEYYYQVSKGYFDKELSDYRNSVICDTGKQVYFMAFSIDGNEPDGIVGFPKQLPETTLDEANSLVASYTKEQADLIAERLSIATDKMSDLYALKVEVMNNITYEEAQQETLKAAGETVMVLEGWYPEVRGNEVKAFLNKSGVYYESRVPVQTDNVPIQFRNNRYNRMFERLTKMYGYPCYDEMDPTPIVAPFFTLFFAICMGDAAYGIIIMLYGLLEMNGKAKKTPILGEMLHGAGDMIFALGIATTVVGLILGSFFGMNIGDIPGLPENVKNYYTFVQGNFPGTTYTFQMVGAIIIGVVHVLLAMVVKAIIYTKKEGFASQISQWGWLILFIGGIVAGAVSMVCSLPQQTTTYILIGIGAVAALCIYVLNNVAALKSNFIKAIIVNPLSGLYATYNMASGIMGDVLSYIRLYALCLAGGKLGEAFNTIGTQSLNAGLADFSTGGIAYLAGVMLILLAIFVYCVGHIANILLSSISAFVHPLRLNFVEYFKNSGYEGKGTAYVPFENKQNNKQIK